MTLNHHDSQLLAALLELARADVPATAIRIAARLERTPDAVRLDLARLERAGFADAARCRLTLPGLVIAADAIRHLAPLARPALRAVRAA